jgi:hypothetical protein
MKDNLPKFKTGNASEWTRERLDRLGRQDIVQLGANAARLGEPELAALCAEVLKGRPRGGRGNAAILPKRARTLVPRGRAFEARGVWLTDARTSWSGSRKSDGTVVLAIWAQAVESRDGGCTCLLWAPNVEGSRPWSESAAGLERLEHCKLAVSSGRAEGLLVHGESLDGHLPEERARTVHGVDPETVIVFRVEKRGREYWASWGKRTAPRKAAAAAPAATAS